MWLYVIQKKCIEFAGTGASTTHLPLLSECGSAWPDRGQTGKPFEYQHRRALRLVLLFMYQLHLKSPAQELAHKMRHATFGMLSAALRPFLGTPCLAELMYRTLIMCLPLKSLGSLCCLTESQCL